MRRFKDYYNNKQLEELLSEGYSLQEAEALLMLPWKQDPKGIPQGTLFTSASNETINKDISAEWGDLPGFGILTKSLGPVQDEGEIDVTYGQGKEDKDGKWIPDKSPKYYGCQGVLGPHPTTALERTGTPGYVVVPFPGTSFSTSGTTWIIAKKFGTKWLGTHFLNKYNPLNSLETKWLTPLKMGVATDSPLKKVEILRNCHVKIDAHRLLSTEIKGRLKAALLLVDQYTGSSHFKGGKGQAKLPPGLKTTVISMETLGMTEGELRVISKDFGEILCAIWACNNIGYEKILFPSAEAEALIDFYGYIKGAMTIGSKWPYRMPVSVKSGAGASTTMANLTNYLPRQMSLPGLDETYSAEEQNIIESYLYIITNDDVMSGILKMWKTLSESKKDKKGAYKALCAVVGENPTVSKIENWLTEPERMMWKGKKVIKGKVKKDHTQEEQWEGAKEVQNAEKVQKQLAPFYKKLGSEPDAASWKLYSKSRLKKKVGVIIGPLGMKLITTMNEDETIKATLTKAARTIVLLQMNVDVKKKAIEIRRAMFRRFKFHFSWGGSTTNPNKNKFGFKAETFK